MLLTRLNKLTALSRNRFAMAILGLTLCLYLTYNLVLAHLGESWPIPGPFGDAQIFFSSSLHVWQTGDYSHLIYPYPPSAVLIFHLLSQGGGAAFMSAWLVLMVIGLLISMRMSVAGAKAEIRSAWMLFGAIGLLLAEYPISWDLRNANSNLVCLGLVLAGYGALGRLPVLCGILVGVSACLKPYSILIIIWLLWRGPRLAGLAGIATGAFLGVIAPLCVFGIDGTIGLYHGWFEQLKLIGDSTSYLHFPAAPVISLRKAAATLSGKAPDAVFTVWVLALFWAVWALSLAWYLRRVLHVRRGLQASLASLADWTVLMLAPLPFSPWLEPYHAVPLLPGAILCTVVAFDPLIGAFDRRVAFGTILLLIFVRMFYKIWPFSLRGILLFTTFEVLVLGLGLLRPRLVSSARTDWNTDVRPEGCPEAMKGVEGGRGNPSKAG
jgi:hypothetical protein